MDARENATIAPFVFRSEPGRERAAEDLAVHLEPSERVLDRRRRQREAVRERSRGRRPTRLHPTPDGFVHSIRLAATRACGDVALFRRDPKPSTIDRLLRRTTRNAQLGE